MGSKNGMPGTYLSLGKLYKNEPLHPCRRMTDCPRPEKIWMIGIFFVVELNHLAWRATRCRLQVPAIIDDRAAAQYRRDEMVRDLREQQLRLEQELPAMIETRTICIAGVAVPFVMCPVGAFDMGSDRGLPLEQPIWTITAPIHNLPQHHAT